MSTPASEHCMHRFERIGWTRTEGKFRRLWSCVACGFWTRTYDSIDRTMTRPIHPHMTVAVPGFNTVERDS